MKSFIKKYVSRSALCMILALGLVGYHALIYANDQVPLDGDLANENKKPSDEKAFDKDFCENCCDLLRKEFKGVNSLGSLRDHIEKTIKKNSFLERLKSSNLSKPEWAGFMLNMGIVTLISGFAGKQLGRYVNPKYHLHNLSPSLNLVGHAFMLPAGTINEIVFYLKELNAALIFSAPLGEEFMMRYVLQDLLLTRLPKKILKKLKIDPKYVELMPTRVARVIVTAYLFAVGHKIPDYIAFHKDPVFLKNHPNYLEMAGIVDEQEKEGFYPQFILGLALSTLKELTGRIEPCIALHCFQNTIAVIEKAMKKKN